MQKFNFSIVERMLLLIYCEKVSRLDFCSKSSLICEGSWVSLRNFELFYGHLINSRVRKYYYKVHYILNYSPSATKFIAE